MVTKRTFFPSPLSFKGNVWKNGRFISSEFVIEKGRIQTGRGEKNVEAAYIVPPFCETHIHGGWGFSFQKSDFYELESKLRSSGILFAVPTLENDDLDTIEYIASNFKEYKKNIPKSIFPFLRIEGPFISNKKKGIQRSRFILEPTKENIERFLDIDEIKLFTFAPEMAGAERLVEAALKKDKIPSIGHSDAGFKLAEKFYQMGIRYLTHFPNAMSGLFHREIGLTGAGFLMDDLELEVIADGVHSSIEFLSLLLKVKGPTFAITSDLMPPAFSELDEIDDRKILKKNKTMTTIDGTIAGGSIPVPNQVKWLCSLGWTPENLIKVACLNGPKFFNFSEPSLEVGNDASFVLLDDGMNVSGVFHQGIEIQKSDI